MKTLSALPSRAAALLPFAALPLALLLGLLAASVGCDPPDEIAEYETPRTEPWVTKVEPEQVREILDHMFAAVIPAKDKAWFFKLVVPGADAAAMREPFDKFVAGVDVSKTSDGHPAWSLPEGWTDEAGSVAMRAATIVVPHGDKKFEITVSTLPLAGEWPAYLKANVDRWMGQLQQPPLPSSTIEKLARKLPTVEGDATLFELVGTMQKAPMGAGLAGIPAGHPPVDERTPQEPGNEKDSPPAASAEPAEPAIAEKLAYDAPAGWQALPPGGGMFPREASFKIASDGGEAEVAVTKFPAFGEMAALGPNVRRWAGQVGILSLTEEGIIEAAHKISLAGEPALQFEFVSPTETSPKAITAVMAKRGGQIWFFKLIGDKAVVENERDAFDAFLKSVRFAKAG